MAKRSPIHYGALPSVDLLPDAQRAEKQHEATLPKLLLALIASAVVAGVVWASGMIPVMTAQQQLSAAQDQSDQIAGEIAALDDAQQVLNQVGGRSADRAMITQNEVIFSDLRNEVVERLPAGATVDSWEFTIPSVGTGDGSASLFDSACLPTGAGASLTVTLPEAVGGFTSLSSFLTDLKKIEGFLCAEVSDSSTAGDADGTLLIAQIELSFDESVRSGRFSEETEQ